MALKNNDTLRLYVSYLIKESPGTRKEFDFDLFNLSQAVILPAVVHSGFSTSFKGVAVRYGYAIRANDICIATGKHVHRYRE